MRVWHIVLIFLVIGGFIIASSYHLNLKEPQDRRTFIGKFSIWVVGVGKNTINTVGYAMKLKWLPEKNASENNNDKLINYTNYVIEE